MLGVLTAAAAAALLNGVWLWQGDNGSGVVIVTNRDIQIVAVSKQWQRAKAKLWQKEIASWRRISLSRNVNDRRKRVCGTAQEAASNNHRWRCQYSQGDMRQI